MPSDCAEAVLRKRTGPAVLVFLAALALGCGRQEGCEDPKEVLNIFFASIEAGDQETAFELLDAETRKRLESMASEANRMTGRSFKPQELLVPHRFDRNSGIAKLLTEGEGKNLTVVVSYEDGSTAPFPLTREGNCYKVHLDI